MAKRLAHLFRVQVCPQPQFFQKKRCNAITVTCASIVVIAAIPQCGNSQTPLRETEPVSVSEAVQTVQSQSNQALDSDPETVIRELLEAMKTNDAQKIRSLFDANASQAYGNGPEKSGEAFFRWLDSDIIQRQGRVENAQLAVNGNEVVVTGQYQSRGYTSEANFLLTVENGRIISWRMRY